jgi:hypothetical protein
LFNKIHACITLIKRYNVIKGDFILNYSQMKSVLQKISTADAEQTTENILSVYE